MRARQNESTLSPQANSSHWETDPESAREEPCQASHMTGSGVHGEWLLENVCVSNILSTSSKHNGGNQCKEWAGAAVVVDTTGRGAAGRLGCQARS